MKANHNTIIALSLVCPAKTGDWFLPMVALASKGWLSTGATSGGLVPATTIPAPVRFGGF